MNEQTKKLLQDYLVKLLEAAEKGAEWTAAQIPLIIQEKLAWEFWVHICYGLLWGLTVVVVAYMSIQLYRANKQSSYLDGFDLYGAPLLLGLLAIPGLIGVCFNLEHVIQISIAPRLYLLDWLRRLL